MLFLINPLAQKEVLVSLEEDIGPHYVSIILLRDNLLELAIHVILLHSLQGLTYREQPLLLSVFGLPLLLSAILFQLVYRPLRLLRTLPIPLAGRYHSLVPLMQSMSRWEHLLILVNVTNFLGVVWLYAWAQHPGAARLIMVYVFCYAFKVLVGLIFNQRDAAETRVKQITGKRLATLRECPICF